MRFTIVTHGPPLPNSNGGPMTCWGILKGLIDSGHQVSVVTLAYPGDPFDTREAHELIKALGVDLIRVPVEDSSIHLSDDEMQRKSLPRKAWRRLKSDLAPTVSSVFPTVGLSEKMQKVLSENAPDAVFAYHWDSLAAIHKIKGIPLVAGVGDLWHHPRMYRWLQERPSLNRSYFEESLSVLGWMRQVPKYMIAMLKDCQISGAFAAHYANWASNEGVDCAYWRSPVTSSVGADWQKQRERVPVTRKPKILLGPSALGSTVTSQGLSVFARDIFPILRQEFGDDGFEVHVIGAGEPPRDLAQILPCSSIIMRGRVHSIDEEFLSADVQLVPTSIKLGVRVRIIKGFTYGCCVVAHRSNALGIPELKHGENVLLSKNGRGLADEIIRAIKTPELRQRLGENAHRTYEKLFAPEVAASPIVAGLERLAARKKERVT